MHTIHKEQGISELFKMAAPENIRKQEVFWWFRGGGGVKKRPVFWKSLIKKTLLLNIEVPPKIDLHILHEIVVM